MLRSVGLAWITHASLMYTITDYAMTPQVSSARFPICMLLAALCFTGSLGAQSLISTIAGGDRLQTAAVATSLFPSAVTVDSKGNWYVGSGSAVYKIDAGGQLSVFAGIRQALLTNSDNTIGDGCPAVDAKLGSVAGLTIDPAGSYLYISDAGNQIVRRVSFATGIITTVAGVVNGASGYLPLEDGVPAVATSIGSPSGIAFDPTGNLYIADVLNSRVWQVDMSTGLLSTFAGMGNGTAFTGIGFSGDGAKAVNAMLYQPTALAFDGQSNLYIADSLNNRIRMVSTQGYISTFAGSGPTGYGTGGYGGDNGPAISALLHGPSGVAVDTNGNVYIGDTGNQRIRKVAGGTISSIAGTGTAGYNGMPTAAGSAMFSNPSWVWTNPAGTLLLICDTFNGALRSLASGIVSTVAGGPAATNGDAGPALDATFGTGAMALDTMGNLFFVDGYGGSKIRKINLATGTISTVAGTGSYGFNGNSGPGTSIELNGPLGLATDTAGNLYIADTANYVIRKLDTNGDLTTIAGNGSQGYSGENVPALTAGFNQPIGIAVDSIHGFLYVGDGAIYQGASYTNSRIRQISLNTNPPMIVTVAGTGKDGTQDGPSATATISQPTSLAVDAAGTVYFTNSEVFIRKLVFNAGMNSGTITTIAGSTSSNASTVTVLQDGHPATAADVTAGALAVSGGNLYFIDVQYYEGRVRRLNLASGTLFTVTDAGYRGYSGDGGNPLCATTSDGAGVCIDCQSGAQLVGNNLAADSNGALYLGDANHIRLITNPAAVVPTASVPILITNVPTDLTYTVDQQQYTGPAIFNWAPGASHQVSAASPQTVEGGTYDFYDFYGGVSLGASGSSYIATGPYCPATVTAYYKPQGACPYSLLNSGYPAEGPPGTTLPGLAFDASGGSGAANLTSAAGCPWMVSNLPPWTQLTSAASGTGNAVVAFSVQANLGSTPRSATIDIQGQPFTIAQPCVNCTFTLAPDGFVTAAAGGANAAVTCTQQSCQWSASTQTPWNQITNGSGTGNGSVGYSVTANNSVSPRIGVIAVGSRNYVITQGGMAPMFQLGAASAHTASGGGGFSVTLSATPADAPWAILGAPSWITITSPLSGSGSTTVTYAVAAENSVQARSATITIANQSFTINQDGAIPAYALDPTSANVPSGGVSSSVMLTATPPDAPWSITGAPAWITITTAASGTGSATVLYTVAANFSANPRNGTVSIGGQTFTVNQDGAPAAYSLNPTSASVSSGASNGSVMLTATPSDASWTISGAPSWVTITSALSGTGSATVTYAIAANNSVSARNGTVTIAGQTFTVNQSGAAPAFSLNPASTGATAAGGPGSVMMTATPPDASWTITGAPSWINVTSALSGTGSATVAYNVAANNSVSPRSGTVIIAGQTFTVNQTGAGASFSIAPPSVNMNASGGSGLVMLTATPADAQWTITGAPPWITITSPASGTGSATVTYTVAANGSANPRNGTVTIAGQTFTVNQSGAAPSFSLSSSSASVAAGGGSGSVNLTAMPADASWTITGAPAWITITSPTSGTGSTTVNYSVAANNSVNSRSAMVTIGGQTFTVNQGGATPMYSLNPTSTDIAAGGGGISVMLTATPPDAPWTVTGAPAWVTITSAAGGTGSATVNLMAAANTSSSPRSGTVAIAGLTLSITQAGLTTSGLAFYPATPCRVADTRNATGPFGGPIMGAGSTRNFAVPSSPCGIPATAQAYSLNVTVVPPGPLGYLTAWPTGQSQPYVSTLNSSNGAVIANAAIVPAGANGAVSVFASDATHVIIDINGYFAPPGSPGALAFYPATPCRVADTRNASGPFGGPSLAAGSTRNLTVPSSSCGIPATAQAYSLNMTVVPPGPLGYLTAWPAGQTQPYVSTLNALQGQIAANAAIVPAGTNGAISVFVSDASDVIVDINGYFGPPGGTGALYFYPATPCRIADTRNANGTFGGPSLGAGATRTFPIPSSSCGLPSTAQAYSLNMTVVPPGSLLYLGTWPAGEAQPVVSTLNDLQGQVIANAAIVPAGTSGAIGVYVSDPTNLIIDINGYFQ